MKFHVTLITSEEGYAVFCPSLPGCCSQGQTEPEALENIRIAIREYLDVQSDSDGRTVVREVEVAV